MIHSRFCRTIAMTGLCLALAGAATGRALAQGYPERAIHVLVGFPPGSGADILARYFSRRLSDLAGKPVIVENKPGATSNIALGLAARAKPDGYTVLYSANSNMAGNRFLFKDLPFDTVKDFTPVALLSQTTFIVVVAPSSKVGSIAELTAALKANARAKFAYTNQIGLLSTQYYRKTVGAEAVAVSYRTAADALPDIQNGTIDFMIIDGTFGMGQIKAGRIKPLAVTTAQRLPTLPDLPTMIEAGIPAFDFASWWAAWLPKGAPPDVVAKLEGWFTAITASPETTEFLSGTAGVALRGGSAVTRARQLAEIEKWAIATKTAGIVPQ
jgi:tripartite-type tricarboxylate transporter receptor subunit TctC